MVVVEMLAVGRELLIGRTANTNAQWAGARLAEMGTMLKRVTAVDDDLGEIVSSFREILRRSPDFLVVVGGLGPTPDDMTLRGIAEGLGVSLKQDRSALSMIRKHYEKRGLADIELTHARRKMALLPEGSEPLMNVVGTAPGVRLVSDGTTVFSLPGVPAEMRSIFTRSIEPEVRGRLGYLHREYATFKVVGILESAMAPIIATSLRRHPGAYIKSHPRGIRGEVSRIELDIAVVGDDARKVREEASAIAREMSEAAKAAGATVKPTGGAPRSRGA